MAGVLSFALGLESGAFSAGVDRAGERLVEFIAIGETVHKVVDGMKEAMARGTELQHLSQQTGQSVKDLYQLQEAFTAVGVEASQLPTMLIRMQQSMSGIGRGAVATKMFAQMGIDVKKLKQLGAADQIDEITQKLAKMDKTKATGFAGQMFGIETGAVPFLQIVGSAESFHDAMKSVARDAQEFAKAAPAFEQLDTSIGFVKSHISGMFAGMAEGLVPTIQQITDKVNNMDFSGMGNNIGIVLAGAFQAFREGKLVMLIADTFVFGFQAAVDLAPGIFAKLGVIILKVFDSALNYLQAGLEYVIQLTMQLIGKIPKVNEVTGLKGFQAQSFGDILKERQKTGTEYFGTGMNAGSFFDASNQAANDSINSGIKDFKAKWAGLFNEFSDYSSRGPQLFAGDDASNKKNKPQDAASVKTAKPNVSALEKMGFIMNRGGGSVDAIKKTATYTERNYQVLKTIHDVLSAPKPTGLVNI